MSEHDDEVVLRAQLSALVADRPATLSPAPLVIAKVRRGRRRRVVAGALAVALAVTGGALLGLDRGATGPTPAKPVPAEPAPSCEVRLPAAWTAALADPKNVLPQGASLVASSTDKSRVYVREGDRIVQLTDRFATRRTVMTLPALPAAFKKATWSVSGTFDGTWLVLALTPDDGHFGNALGLYAWNATTGASRTLLAATAHPTREMNDWVAGAGRVAWQSEPFEADGFVRDGSVTSHLVTLAAGSEHTGENARAFVGNTMLVLGKDNVPFGVSLATGAPVGVPDELTAFLRANASWGSATGDGSAFAWGRGVPSAGLPPGATIKGPTSWDVWWPGSPSVVRVTAPKGFYVASVTPIAPGYAVATFPIAKTAAGNGVSTVLVDLRSRSLAPLTAAQEDALDGTARVVDTTKLPHLPGC